MEFFNFVNGFGFLNLCLIFGWVNGQLWGKIQIFGIFFIPFSKFHHEDDGIFKFCKRIRIPHFFLDFWVGEWTTLEQKSNFRNFSRVFSKFPGEDDNFLLSSLRIRILWFFCYFLVREWTKSKVFIFSAKSTRNYNDVS